MSDELGYLDTRRVVIGQSAWNEVDPLRSADDAAELTRLREANAALLAFAECHKGFFDTRGTMPPLMVLRDHGFTGQTYDEGLRFLVALRDAALARAKGGVT